MRPARTVVTKVGWGCPNCSGSGEGMSDGTRCWRCGGKGEVPCDACYYIEYDDEWKGDEEEADDV